MSLFSLKNRYITHNQRPVTQTLLIQKWPSTNASGSHSTVSANKIISHLCLSKTQLKQPRWILLIAPPVTIKRQHLIENGIDPSKVLVIHKKQIKRQQQIVTSAMATEKFSVIVNWIDSDKDTQASSVIDNQQCAANQQSTKQLSTSEPDFNSTHLLQTDNLSIVINPHQVKHREWLIKQDKVPALNLAALPGNVNRP